MEKERSADEKVEEYLDSLENSEDGDKSDPNLEFDRKSNATSNLSFISDENEYFEEKCSYQRRALFRKNAALQMRQIGTNITQVMTPILGLAVIVLIKNILTSNINFLFMDPINVSIPMLYQLPYGTISSLGIIFNTTNCDVHYAYDFENKEDYEQRDYFGFNKGIPIMLPDKEGMIGNLLQFPCPTTERSSPSFSEVPYNETINQFLYRTVESFNSETLDFNTIEAETKGIDRLPDGAFLIKEMSEKQLNYRIQVNDNKYLQMHKNNGVTRMGLENPETGELYQLIRVVEGQLMAADTINGAFMRQHFPNLVMLNGMQYMPMGKEASSKFMRVMNILSSGIFPICLSLFLPVFTYTMVLEKETKLLEIMKMNGLQMKNYWFMNFVFNFLIYSVGAFVFMFFGYVVFALEIFTETSFILQLWTLLGWGLSQIGLAFFLTVFLDKSQSASITGYLLSLFTTLMAVSLNATLYEPPHQMPLYFKFYPTFAFARAYYLMGYKCGFEICIGSIDQFPEEGNTAVWLLYLEGLVFLVLGLYLAQTVPGAFGVKKHPCFCFREIRECCQKKKKTKGKHILLNDIDEEEVIEISKGGNDDFDPHREDQDSKDERNRVYNLEKSEYYKFPLIIKDLRKVYPGYGGRAKKAATKKFCLVIKKGEMFGLLGPNGAGKTTLISMLTGLYPANGGNAWVAGFDIKTRLDQVQLQMGVCPQFDILWKDLTVKEHLLFYARLKGISPETEEAMVEKAITEVKLERFANFKTKQLSGGMRRRLSVAISLVGEPKIVFLDEPSTGLDPENRRQLWDILGEARGKRAIILTTHSMEEADVLCNRIGIVTDGVLRCVGKQIRLKTLYGGGYHLFVNCHRGRQLKIIQKENENTEEFKDSMKPEDIHQRVKDFIKGLLPNVILIQEFNGNFVFQIPMEKFDAGKLFVNMESNRKNLMISDWGISQSSLEDVFTRIVET